LPEIIHRHVKLGEQTLSIARSGADLANPWGEQETFFSLPVIDLSTTRRPGRSAGIHRRTLLLAFGLALWRRLVPEGIKSHWLRSWSPPGFLSLHQRTLETQPRRWLAFLLRMGLAIPPRLAGMGSLACSLHFGSGSFPAPLSGRGKFLADRLAARHRDGAGSRARSYFTWPVLAGALV
jgi:hypothetical protein